MNSSDSTDCVDLWLVHHFDLSPAFGIFYTPVSTAHLLGWFAGWCRLLVPEKKDYSIFRYAAYFIQNEFGNRGAGEEKNSEFPGKNPLGEGGGSEGVNELCKKKIQILIINSTLYCLRHIWIERVFSYPCNNLITMTTNTTISLLSLSKR